MAGFNDVGLKMLNGIKSMYVNSSACIRVKRVESEWFGIDIEVRQGCVMFLLLFNLCMDGAVEEFKVEM